jgi:hypothetical protein
MTAMRASFDDLLRQVTLLTLAAAIALGYAVLSLAQGFAALILSGFTERGDAFSSGGGTLTLDVGGRTLDFAQLVVGVIEVAVVLAAILYVVRPDQRDQVDEEAAGGE